MVASKKTASPRAKAKHVVVEKKTLAKTHGPAVATIERRAGNRERRNGDRRKQSVPVPIERRTLERRAKVCRRRQIDPTTCERDYSSDEIEFMGAIDEYKRTSGRMFPTCSEVLEVIKSLGYVKCVKVDAPTLSSDDAPTATSSNPVAV